MGSRSKVAVLMGGPSPERDISIKSGVEVLQALRAAGYDAFAVEVRTDTGCELDRLRCDVAFIALHGTFGEDGTVQRMLEARGIPYTGSDAEASAAGMDKVESKRRFKFYGLETPPHRVISRGDSRDLLEQYGRSLGYPVVIKPRAQGSSVGVTMHSDWTTVADGAAEAFRYGAIALMEKHVAGREMTVGILAAKALPIIEIRPRSTIFDFAAKYQDAETMYLVKPPMSDLDRRRITKAAVEANHAVQAEGFSRVDLIFTPLHGVQVLEVNTIPGMTPRSLFPMAARAEGIEFPDLCRRIVEQAFKRRLRFGWSAAVF